MRSASNTFCMAHMLKDAYTFLLVHESIPWIFKRTKTQSAYEAHWRAIVFFGLPIIQWYFVPKLFWPSVRIQFDIRDWRPRICKYFEITRTIYSNSERLEQFLKQDAFLTYPGGFSDIIHNNNYNPKWNLETKS